MMVENLMLQVTAAEIKDDQPLFGPGSLGLIQWMPFSSSWRWTKILA